MDENCNEDELRDLLLYSSRNGDIDLVKDLLQALAEGKVSLDVNCKGKLKSNLGWTPLHLATYFGHREVVELLLDNWADINSVNDAGDTPLHKASFIDREDLVLLLVKRNADVNIRNGEGRTAREVGVPGGDSSKLLSAAEKTDSRRREDALLSAARNGDITAVNDFLKSERPPNINCVDNFGNTSLHCASYRGHKEIAVLLLQNGIDTTIKNLRGQTALDLSKDVQMSQVLSVKPVRQLQKTVARFEGQLLKRSRFLGWKVTWVVLERGVLTYFTNRADASSGVKRRDFKYLDGARPEPSELTPSVFTLYFSDGTMHKLSAPISMDDPSGELSRQKWLTALGEHIAFNTHYLNQGRVLDDSDDEDNEIKPLGTMQDALQTASAKYQLLETRLQEISSALGSAPAESCHPLVILTLKRFEELSDSASGMIASLSHCLNLIQQQEEVRVLQVKQEQEKCRVLEEALSVLAKEHHELEQSMASHLSSSPPTKRSLAGKRNPRFYDTSDDEFYDAFEAESESALVTALSSSPSSDSDTLVCIPSPTSSIATLASLHSFQSALDLQSPHHRCFPYYSYRERLPVAMFSRNDFSIWSVLKNSIGKELSKITMPVVFNEPLSFLQRMVEYMEYAHLLRVASDSPDPIQRMQYICAFAVSALASNWDRLGKPFNPLLGETYELERPEFRVICEQVSHHPPVSAFHADSESFIFHGSIHPKLKFWGKSVEIQPKGTVTVQLPKWGEAFTWSNVNCCVHNIIVGKLWIEQYGSMEIVNHSSGLKAVLTFKPGGWFSKDLHRVEGYIMDKNKKKSHFLYGKWTEFIRCTDYASYEEYFKENAHKFRSESKGPPGSSDSPSHTPKKVLAKLNSLKVGPFKSQNSVSEVDDGPEDHESTDIPKCDSTYSIDIPNSVTLWEVETRPDNTTQFYNFTTFAMSLNEMEPGMDKKLCSTDCRLRPDIRKLENGDLDGAAAEKTRLEEKQRDARKARKNKKGQEWNPRWFCSGTNPYTGQEDWLYTGGYWDRNFGPDPIIF